MDSVIIASTYHLHKHIIYLVLHRSSTAFICSTEIYVGSCSRSSIGILYIPYADNNKDRERLLYYTNVSIDTDLCVLHAEGSCTYIKCDHDVTRFFRYDYEQSLVMLAMLVKIPISSHQYVSRFFQATQGPYYNEWCDA